MVEEVEKCYYLHHAAIINNHFDLIFKDILQHESLINRPNPKVFILMHTYCYKHQHPRNYNDEITVPLLKM